MQDRFRFRVWNKKNKEMIYNAEIAYDGMNYNTSWQIGKNTNDGWVDCFGYYLDYPEDYEVMQCIGLKDKNGKLIYEGDIVSDKSNHIRVVVWEQDCFKYPALKTSRYFHRPILNQLEERKIGLRGKLTFQDAIGKCDKKCFEVIGNIYENPELIGGADKCI